jgi:predicted dehydrogenase
MGALMQHFQGDYAQAGAVITSDLPGRSDRHLDRPGNPRKSAAVLMKTPPPLPFARSPPPSVPIRRRCGGGIIGCGDVTEVKSGPGFRLAEGSQLVAVMRRNGALAADYARRHGVPRWYDRAEALIADPEVDAVYIATPPDSHESYALQVAAAGKPAYVEKPMARSTVECDRMVAAFHARGVPLYVAYYRRGSAAIPPGQTLDRRRGHRAADRRRLPLRLRRPPLPVPAGARTCGRPGPACFSTWVPTPSTCSTFLSARSTTPGARPSTAPRPQDAEDSVALQFSARGVLGVATWNFASGVARDLCRLTGTDGCIEYSTFDNVPVRLTTAQGTESVEIPHPPHVQQPLIQQVVHDLLGRDRCPSTGVSARRTSQVMDAALTSYYGDRTGALLGPPRHLAGATRPINEGPAMGRTPPGESPVPGIREAPNASHANGIGPAGRRPHGRLHTATTPS